ncbi:hypothetical protein LguiB_020739 [Lonicera macranthoides]
MNTTSRLEFSKTNSVGFFTLHHLYSTLGFLHTSPIARVHLPRFRLFFGNIHTGDLSIPTTISKAFKTHPANATLQHLLQLTTDCTVGQNALNSDFVKNSASALNLPAPEGTLLHQAPPQLSSGILRSSEQAPALVAASSNFSPLNKTFLGQNYLQNNSPSPAVRQSGGIQGLIGNFQANTGDRSVGSTPQLSTVQNLRIDDIDRALVQVLQKQSRKDGCHFNGGSPLPGSPHNALALSSANQDGINTNSPSFACNIDEVNGVFSPTPVAVETTFVALQNHPQSPTDSTQIPPFLTTGLE